VAYKIPYLLQKNTPDFQLQFHFLGLIYQIRVGNVFENKIHSNPKHHLCYYCTYGYISELPLGSGVEIASAVVYGRCCQIGLDKFLVTVNSVMLYHHTTINYHLYINYTQQTENYGGSSVMYITYSMFSSI